MDSFFVPALVGQVYTMPGMQTILHGVINKPGEYKGFSANFSGSGFTDMRFKFHGMEAQDFDKWVARARAAGGNMNLAAYDKLRQPSRAEPVHYYAKFDPHLYERVLNLCVQSGGVCQKQMGSMQGMPAHQSMKMPAEPEVPSASTSGGH
jgi:cytochrome o ubiquinol oxidase subunit 2